MPEGISHLPLELRLKYVQFDTATRQLTHFEAKVAEERRRKEEALRVIKEARNTFVQNALKAQELEVCEFATQLDGQHLSDEEYTRNDPRFYGIIPVSEATRLMFKRGRISGNFYPDDILDIRTGFHSNLADLQAENTMFALCSQHISKPILELLKTTPDPEQSRLFASRIVSGYPALIKVTDFTEVPKSAEMIFHPVRQRSFSNHVHEYFGSPPMP
jgi:hypothetical protein